MATAPVLNKPAGKQEMLWYFTLLAAASLIWSAQGTAVKFLDRNMGPIAITFLPFYITTVLFVPLLIRKRRANPGRSAHVVRLGASSPWPECWGRCSPNLA